jgi:hypothetical protein
MKIPYLKISVLLNIILIIVLIAIKIIGMNYTTGEENSFKLSDKVIQLFEEYNTNDNNTEIYKFHRKVLKEVEMYDSSNRPSESINKVASYRQEGLDIQKKYEPLIDEYKKFTESIPNNPSKCLKDRIVHISFLYYRLFKDLDSALTMIRTVTNT